MPIEHTARFGIYHWDTVDDETMLLSQADTIKEAEEYVKKHCCVEAYGADQVDIVDLRGNVIRTFPIG